ncbi:uncharacterized protein LOC34619050 [Cyclospora cayetanensis]|nr:uncharacterized protein LOC34619050 [Cyclospora cayetanensis]
MLEAELLQLLQHSRQQLQQLKLQQLQVHDCCEGPGATGESGSSKDGMSPGYCGHAEASWACLLQNLRTALELRQQLNQQQQDTQEASAAATSAASIEAIMQDLEYHYRNGKRCESLQRPLLQLRRKYVYWHQRQQHQKVLLELVDWVLADIEVWAQEAPSDDEMAASMQLETSAAAKESMPPTHHQLLSAIEQRQQGAKQEHEERQLLLQHIGNGGSSGAMVPTAVYDESALIEEDLLGAATEMKQGALRFRETLQKDNRMLERTSATQDTMQQQQIKGVEAAKKLLRFSFFSSLMPLVQLAIALMITMAMIFVILFTPG